MIWTRLISACHPIYALFLYIFIFQGNTFQLFRTCHNVKPAHWTRIRVHGIFTGFFILTQVRVLVECVVFNRLLFLVVCTLFEKGMVFAIFFVWWYFLIFLETSPVYSINKYTVTSTSTWHLYYTWFISLTVTRSPTYIPPRIPLHTTLSYPTCPS